VTGYWPRRGLDRWTGRSSQHAAHKHDDAREQDERAGQETTKVADEIAERLPLVAKNITQAAIDKYPGYFAYHDQEQKAGKGIGAAAGDKIGWRGQGR